MLNVRSACEVTSESDANQSHVGKNYFDVSNEIASSREHGQQVI
jgi:hypothetical protein